MEVPWLLITDVTITPVKYRTRFAPASERAISVPLTSPVYNAYRRMVEGEGGGGTLPVLLLLFQARTVYAVLTWHQFL